MSTLCRVESRVGQPLSTGLGREQTEDVLRGIALQRCRRRLDGSASLDDHEVPGLLAGHVDDLRVEHIGIGAQQVVEVVGNDPERVRQLGGPGGSLPASSLATSVAGPTATVVSAPAWWNVVVAGSISTCSSS